MANTIVRWNPFREMMAMQNAFDQLYQQNRNPYFERGRFGGSAALALDIDESNTAYTITTELPGANPDNINVQLHDGILTIDAELPEHAVEQEGAKALVRERRYGRVTRSVRLPQMVDFNSAEANFEHGVLTLNLPKSPDAQPRSIPVKSFNGNGSTPTSQN